MNVTTPHADMGKVMWENNFLIKVLALLKVKTSYSLFRRKMGFRMF